MTMHALDAIPVPNANANLLHSMPDDGDNARQGSPKFSPCSADQPALLSLRQCGRLADIGLQVVGSLVGTLRGASSFYGFGLSGTPSSSYNLSSGSYYLSMVVGFSWRLSCVSNHSTRSASINQCRATSWKASLTPGWVLCAARCLAANPRRR